ncbi:GrpB family protein [Yokenella regensburgei]
MRKITVAEYDAQWPARFAAESALLQRVLGKVMVRIHHIGSTSVPGLAAKPVIDILLEVNDLTALDGLNPAMAEAGYRARGENGIAGRRYFTRGDNARSHQLHAFVTGDPQIRKHLAFRDYLRKNRDVAAAYAQLKRAAVLAAEGDSQGYSALKEAFIAHHLRLALGDEKSTPETTPSCCVAREHSSPPDTLSGAHKRFDTDPF